MPARLGTSWKRAALVVRGAWRNRDQSRTGCVAKLCVSRMCELCCWSGLGSMCSVFSVLAHAEGLVLAVLDWSQAERCKMRGADGCSAECERRAAGCQESK